MNEYLAYGAKILSILLSIYISPKRKSPSFSTVHLEKVVKITSGLLKSYDFTSQHVYNVSNQVKTRNQSNSIKISQTRLKSVKLDRFYKFDRFRVLTRKSSKNYCLPVRVP
jgi:hypothetical protein